MQDQSESSSTVQQPNLAVTQDSEGYWIGGIFCGTQIAPNLYAESVASRRFVIRETEMQPFGRRVGEVFGGDGVYQACTMKGDHVGKRPSLLQAALLLVQSSDHWRTVAKEEDPPHAVIRFKRDISFPRFSMAKGERWGFVVFGKKEAIVSAIKSGGRFEFAGGQCLADDVELIYEGPGNINYSKAAGYIRD